MNIIGQIDQSAFATGPRMHHGEDEVALEFPSSVSSRARGLLALRAQNWRAAKAPSGGYVTDGLVAMWTAADLGESIASGLWTDVVGGAQLQSPWGRKQFLFDEENKSVRISALYYRHTFTFSGAATVEICANQAHSFGGANCFWQCNSNGQGAYLGAFGSRTPASGYASPGSALANVGIKTARIMSDQSGASYSNSLGKYSGTAGVVGTSCEIRIGVSSNIETGPFHCVRLYNRVLSDDEIGRNAEEDMRLFGVS